VAWRKFRKRKIPQCRAKIVLDDLAISFVGLRSDFGADVFEPSCEPLLYGHAIWINMLSGINCTQKPSQLFLGRPSIAFHSDRDHTPVARGGIGSKAVAELP
jgi:hypothetical protein